MSNVVSFLSCLLCFLSSKEVNKIILSYQIYTIYLCCSHFYFLWLWRRNLLLSRRSRDLTEIQAHTYSSAVSCAPHFLVHSDPLRRIKQTSESHTGASWSTSKLERLLVHRNLCLTLLASKGWSCYYICHLLFLHRLGKIHVLRDSVVPS